MHKNLNYVIVGGVVVVLLLVGMNLLMYKLITDDYTQKLSSLDNKLDSVSDNLVNAIQAESEYSSLQREILENQTLSNFEKLQNYFNSETSKLKLDLETTKQSTATQLEGITEKVGGLEEKSNELSDKISEIDVESSDFSAIVDDVIMAVVSVKTDLGQGSGVIFDSDGYVLTNRHVVDGASRITVYDYNSDTYAVSVIGYAQNSDLAVLKIQSDESFNYLRFADDVNVGERVIAVGNPLGLSFTVTEGIVSAVNRVIDSSGVPYIQTDVPINPGNSGGPLVDSSERIVGINTLKITDTEGIGFAIPYSIAADIAEQALN